MTQSGGKPNPNIVDFDRVAKLYADSGAETRRLFSELVDSQPQSILFHDPGIDGAVDGILFDIKPEAPSAVPLSAESMTKCPASADISFVIAREAYKLDSSKRVLCVPKDARALDALYAHMLAGVMLGAAGTAKPGVADKQKADSLVGPRYAEALDRTRLDENVSTYPTGGCASCKSRLRYP